jgi:hypothetical protein
MTMDAMNDSYFRVLSFPCPERSKSVLSRPLNYLFLLCYVRVLRYLISC